MDYTWNYLAEGELPEDPDHHWFCDSCAEFYEDRIEHCPICDDED